MSAWRSWIVRLSHPAASAGCEIWRRWNVGRIELRLWDIRRRWNVGRIELRLWDIRRKWDDGWIELRLWDIWRKWDVGQIEWRLWDIRKTNLTSPQNLFLSHTCLSLQTGKPHSFSLAFLQTTLVLLNLPSMYTPWTGGILKSHISDLHMNPQIYMTATNLNKCIDGWQATWTWLFGRISSGSCIVTTVFTIEQNH